MNDRKTRETEQYKTEQHKKATRNQWNKSAKEWNDQMPKIRAWLAGMTDTMLDLANVKPGSRVLDVAAGAGNQTLDIARRIGDKGYVLATDISPDILKIARQNAHNAGITNVKTKVADGEDLGLNKESFEAAVCRLGLMFYPDPLKGLREIHHALKSGGRFCSIVFSEPQKNPCLGIVVSTALKHAGMPPRDPFQPGELFSLGKPGYVEELFKQAGFSNVTTTKVAAPFSLPTTKDYLNFITTSAGPIIQILSQLNETAKNAAWAEIEDKLNVFQTASGWQGPNELLLTVGTTH